jgi:hypothetical protein
MTRHSVTFVRLVLPLAALFFLTACGSPQRAAVSDLGGREDLSLFTLASLQGARDGDRLQARAMFSDSSSILTLEFRFAIGAPTRLESGTWRWLRNSQISEGTITARSVIFLGGQSGPPSIGGTFELLERAGAPHYRVTLPVAELKPLPTPAHPS